MTCRSGDLGGPARVVGEPAVQDIDLEAGRVRRDEQVRGRGKRGAQLIGTQGASQRQVSERRCRAEAEQPSRDPAQIPGGSVGIRITFRREQVLDEVLPQVAGVLIQLLPRRHARRRLGRVQRCGGRQGGRHGIQQHLVQRYQPLSAEFVAQEIPYHIMQADHRTVAGAGQRQ